MDALAQKIQVNVNRAADVNPINLLALALLSTPKHAMGEADLLAQIALSKTLLADVAYSEWVTVTPHTPQQIIAHGEEIGLITRTQHPLGDVLGVEGDQAVLLSYFRNNVLHVFILPALIACVSRNTRRRVAKSCGKGRARRNLPKSCARLNSCARTRRREPCSSTRWPGRSSTKCSAAG